jgi:hypothetical protein
VREQHVKGLYGLGLERGLLPVHCILLFRSALQNPQKVENEGALRNYYLQRKIMTGNLAEIAHYNGRKMFKYAYAS